MKYWMYASFKERKEDEIRYLKDKGITSLVIGLDKECIEIASHLGLDVYVCTGTYSLPKSDSNKYLSVDINGNRQIWFGSGCPNQSEIRDRNLEKIRDICNIDGIKGVFLDGARFASPASGLEPFFTCFCDTCRDKALKLGYDFERLKSNVTRLYRIITLQKPGIHCFDGLQAPIDMFELVNELPGVFDWIRFRRDCTTEHIINVSKVIKESDSELEFGMYIFTPSLSPLVGQSYVALREVVDIFSPMIYRYYPDVTVPAPLNSELAAFPLTLSKRTGIPEDTLTDFILRFTGLSGGRKLSLKELARELPVESLTLETKKARALIGDKRLVPIIYLNDDRIEESVDSIKIGRADDLSFYVYREELKDMVERACR